jgi:HEAT repeat protein
MRQQLHDWQLRTRDLGLLSEYEMHRRAEGSTQYAVGQSEQDYPLRRILSVAELAGERAADHLPRLLTFLDDSEPTVRWWAVLGLVMLGEQARPAESALMRSLKDDSALVRVAAAEALFQLGHVGPARAALVDALSHPTPFVRLRAMNVLYRMGEHARPARPAIARASMEGIYPAEYLNRLVEYLPASLDD